MTRTPKTRELIFASFALAALIAMVQMAPGMKRAGTAGVADAAPAKVQTIITPRGPRVALATSAAIRTDSIVSARARSRGLLTDPTVIQAEAPLTTERTMTTDRRGRPL